MINTFHLIISFFCYSQILASVGIRSKKLPLHEDYILTISNCGEQTEPKPAVMADRSVGGEYFLRINNVIISEEQRDAEYLWNLIKCDKITTSNANNIKGFSFYLIIARFIGI